MSIRKFSAEGRFECGLDDVVAGKVWAFVPVLAGDTFGLGVAVANEPGYHPVPRTWCSADTYGEASDHADELNIAEGKSDEEAMRIVCSSMSQGKRRKA